jgi:hypothetical protein
MLHDENSETAYLGGTSLLDLVASAWALEMPIVFKSHLCQDFPIPRPLVPDVACEPCYLL